MSTERPIIFSAEMVRALIDGRKTQTRRLIKPQPVWRESAGLVSAGWCYAPGGGSKALNGAQLAGWPDAAEFAERLAAHCPYGKPGDRLWVRETWAWSGDATIPQDARVAAGEVWYAADGTYTSPAINWRPSIHMWRWASRITLQIKSIRIERLQDISEADAIAEGIEPCNDGWKDYDGSPGYWMDPIDSFRGLWAGIHKRGSQYCFGNNPWVWVVDFVVQEAQP